MSGYFVPTVMILTILVAVVWYDFGPEPRVIFPIVVLVTTLIIACPCALGLATPTSLTVEIGKGARRERHFDPLGRCAARLQASEKLNSVILDKTGTITKGKPALPVVLATPGHDESNVLRLTASLERGSEHPLGEAIVKGAKARSLGLSEAEGFAPIPGHVTGLVKRGRMIYQLDEGGQICGPQSRYCRSRTGEDRAGLFVTDRTPLLGIALADVLLTECVEPRDVGGCTSSTGLPNFMPRS